MLPEPHHIVVEGIEVFLRRIVLNEHLGELYRRSEPEFQCIQEQKHHQVKGQGIDGQAEYGKHPGKADGNHGHNRDQQYHPEI